MKKTFRRAALALSICAAASAASAAVPTGADRSFPPALLALQPLSSSSSAITSDGASVELVELNRTVGRWLLLRVPGSDGTPIWAHLDLGQEGASRARLEADGNLHIDSGKGKSAVCKLDTPQARALFSKTYPVPFTPLCDGALFVRSKPARGYKSNLESVTDWLREQGPLGEKIITWRKDIFPPKGDAALAALAAEPVATAPWGPQRAQLPNAPSAISTANLGLKTGSTSIAPGTWAAVQGAPGVWASISSPAMAAPIFSKQGHSSSDSLAYFMAIETHMHDPRYSVGVDHPSVGWSTRAPGHQSSSGPDGLSSVDPLDRVGIVPPWAMKDITAVIAGGFKREHSAFKDGPLSRRNNGTHYGFVEAGVVLSKLQPGLVTFMQRSGEQPRIKVWGPEDEALGAERLIFARQNGLPLVTDSNPGKDLAIAPGGNWSGNATGAPETVRSALCVAQSGSRSFLIYGVFSRAVPRDMAQLMMAYNCKNAMQLDMNAPALTYAAVAAKDEKGHTHYMSLMGAMDDKSIGGTARFTNLPDSRDFIYFVRR